MDIEGEFRLLTLSRNFELDTWADAEKAKIKRMADEAREHFKEPVQSMDALLRALSMNQASPSYLQQQANANACIQGQGAMMQYGYDPNPFAYSLAGMLGFPCALPLPLLSPKLRHG